MDISRNHAGSGREPPELEASRFHVVSVGWGPGLISGLLDKIEDRTGYRFSHVVLTRPDLDALSGGRQGREPAYCLREAGAAKMHEADLQLLESLEQPGVPTIHNMIMGDRVTRRLEYREALEYATFLSRRLADLYRQIQPSVVIGAFDSLHAGLALAVARQSQIPWFALHFTAIPKGLCCFCTGMAPGTAIAIRSPDGCSLRTQAERTLVEFEQRESEAAAYSSANNTAMIIRRLPKHVSVLYNAVKRLLTGRSDRFTEQSAWDLCRQYLRKRVNLYRLPTDWFCEAPPVTPYLFFGLHMQPESSIDVWAPFHADQFNVIESNARSMPPTHQLLVKVHGSDADNYSRADLGRLRRLPGVSLVSPFARSRDFIENASLVLAIQGTMALEAALLGKPVLMFGESDVVRLPSVSRVAAITELPGQVRAKLSERRPDRDAIIRGLIAYLSPYAPAMLNDWDVLASPAEIDALTDRFRELHDFLQAQQPVGQ
jgi:hypothetical protein